VVAVSFVTCLYLQSITRHITIRDYCYYLCRHCFLDLQFVAHCDKYIKKHICISADDKIKMTKLTKNNLRVGFKHNRLTDNTR